MNDTFDPTVGPGPDEQAAAPADPVNTGEIPAEPAPQYAAAEPAPAETVVPPANQEPVPEAPAPDYAPPAAPPYPPRQPAQQPYPAQPVYPPQQPARAASPYETAPQAEPQEPRPGRKSPYAPMSGIGMAVQLFLMNIPVIGLVLSILWACGVCRKIARRSLARAHLILLVIGILLLVAAAIVLRFCFTEEITRLFEQAFPGYTIKWG